MRISPDTYWKLCFPRGIEGVSKIVMCIGTKLWYCLQKNADFLGYLAHIYVNAVFVFKLIT